MDQAIALITGASRGIGYELAKQLGARGVQIIALARTVGGLEDLDDAITNAGGLPAILVPLDLAKADSEFDALGLHLHERFGRLDYFFANAATLGPLSPVGHIQPKDWQKVLATNLTANYRLLRSIDPLLKQSRMAKVIFMTCGQGNMTEAYWGAYAASKAGLEKLAQSYALENQHNNIEVQIHDPGVCASHLRRDAFPGEDQTGLTQPEDAAQKLLKIIGLA